MNELVREIEEDIRRERVDKLWNSFGRVMVGASVLIVLSTIGVVMVQNHHQSRAMENTSLMIKGIDRMNIEDFKSAIPIFSTFADQPSSSYYGLAMLRKAQAESALGNPADAKKTYQALAEHDAVFGELAKLMLGAGGEDIAAPVKTSPFYYTQSEWKAWQLLKQGKKPEAVTMFKALYDDAATPVTMRQRMVEVLAHIAPEQLADKLAQKLEEKSPQTDNKEPAND